jgi:hypothetical protein
MSHIKFSTGEGETLEFFVDLKEIILYLETTTTFHLSAMQMIDILIDL